MDGSTTIKSATTREMPDAVAVMCGPAREFCNLADYPTRSLVETGDFRHRLRSGMRTAG